MAKLFSFLVLLMAFSSACFFRPSTGLGRVAVEAQYRLPSDDSLMSHEQSPRTLPYNRILSPAGQEIVFGNPAFENHSLDCKVLPDHKTVLVEDRYGIACIDRNTRTLIARFNYTDEAAYKNLTSTYSGITYQVKPGGVYFFWSASSGADKHLGYIMMARWDGHIIHLLPGISLAKKAPSPLALPNQIQVSTEGGKDYLYVVLNGNNELLKIDLTTKIPVWSAQTGVAPYGLALLQGKAYVTNWGGPVPTDTVQYETAGVPYGKAYINPATGAISRGSVSVMDMTTGQSVNELRVGLHPTAIIADSTHGLLYTTCSSSDQVYVLGKTPLAVLDSISVRLDGGARAKASGYFIGDSPNALVLDGVHGLLYVANGMDNALAVVALDDRRAPHRSGPIPEATYFGDSRPKQNFPPNARQVPFRSVGHLLGFIPTGAYPAGLDLEDKNIWVANLEGGGAWVNSRSISPKIPVAGKTNTDIPNLPEGAYNSHHQLASVSVIAIPDRKELLRYTERVKRLNLQFRLDLIRLSARPNRAPVPVPERQGEPSVFKHIVYIIKENRTYDQVLGDMAEGRGSKSLCIYGDSVTPNQHALAREFLLMDNFYASGKCSAEGHQWADEGMVSDYVEKNVRSWFRSYPHVQTDALVYTPTGFIWNNALDHGQSVRIYGEAAVPILDKKYTWTSIYEQTLKKQQIPFTNYSTISRVRPILSPHYPASDSHLFNDGYRAQAFIDELHEYEAKPGDSLPNLLVMALSGDHTAGVRPGFPTPRAMVADNDLALGRIIEALTHSRFYPSTAIFVMEDDSQAGWDHISAYRTTAFVISPYSRRHQTLRTNYNQTSVVRTIEQILGLPAMNALDATALPMFDCFQAKADITPYRALPAHLALNEMNPSLSKLKGKALYWAKLASRPEYAQLDQGDDQLMNQMLWFSARGLAPYPGQKNMKGEEDHESR